MDALALLESSPYGEHYAHIDALVASPGYSAAGWHSDQSKEFLAVLNHCTPRSDGARAVLEKIRAAYEEATTAQANPG